MASDSLLSALQSNYGAGGGGDDVTSVRGLLNFCRDWIKGRVHPEELNNPCIEMAYKLRQAAADYAADLSSNPSITPAMREPIERSIEGYNAIADLLEELPELARDGNLRDFQDDLDVYEEERLAVLNAQDEMQNLLCSNAPICPKCGGTGEGIVCEPCQRIRLYLNPDALSLNPEPVRGVYGDVYRMYRRVITGSRSLGELWGTLFELEEHLELLQYNRKQAQRKLEEGGLPISRQDELSTLKRLLEDADGDVQLALAGIERMRLAEESLKASDLRRGWEDILQASLSLERMASRFIRDLGTEEEEEGLL